MFRASSCPSSGATTPAVAASGLPLERGDSSFVGRGRSVPTRCRQPQTYVKPEAAITVFELLMISGVSPETC
jgi:hypothetical protein